MNKKERVDAALRGAAIDRVPASMWGHDYEREWSAQGLAEAMEEQYTRYDWDYVKVCPRSSYQVEGWKVKVQPSGEKHRPPLFGESPIKSPADWKRLRPLEPDQGALGEQLKALQLLNHTVGYDAYVLETLYCPLGVATLLAGNRPELVQQSLREERSAMHSALRIITETYITFAVACLEYGASGIFYSTKGWASEQLLTLDQYREFGEQYDLELLDAIKGRTKFSVVHNCGQEIYFDLLATYPVQAISWAAGEGGNPDLQEGKKRSGKAVIGGVSTRALKQNSPRQVQDEVGLALEQTGGKQLLVGPGCSVPVDTSEKNLEAVRTILS